MVYNPRVHHRRSIRLQGYDYSSSGAYFVTLCTQNRECVFGEIVEGEMRLSPIGRIALQCWQGIPDHFKNVQLDAYVIMPDHVHGIVIIQNEAEVGVRHVELRQNTFQHIVPNSLSSIVLQYKASVTRICRRENFTRFRWQRNYYEHIIRREKDYHAIQRYIIDNPFKWHFDAENLGKRQSWKG